MSINTITTVYWDVNLKKLITSTVDFDEFTSDINFNLEFSTSNICSNIFNILFIDGSNQIYNNLSLTTSNYNYNSFLNLISYTNQTSNNIINYANLNSNDLYRFLTNNSNNLISYNNLTSNDLIKILTNTSNNLINYTNSTSNRLFIIANNNSNNSINYTNLLYNNLLNISTTNSNNLINYNNLNSNNLNSIINSKISDISANITLTSNNLITYNNTNFNNLQKNINDTSINSTNYTNSKINSLNTDLISIGTSNKFITNNNYNDNLIVNGIFYTSNIITSNLSVTGAYNIVSTNNYNTEKLEIENDGTATTIIAKQLSLSKNVAEFYNKNNPTLIISSQSNIGIGKLNPNINYKLDINGNLNASEIFINDINLSDKILNTSNDLYIFTYDSSNKIINYNNLYNRPNIFTKTETSNIFVTSNVLSNTSNRLADYNNLYNRPDIFTKTETSNIFVTSNVLSNTSNRLADYNNLYNRPDIFTKTETSNIFVTSNVLSNTSNRLADYNNLYNRPDIFTKTETSNIFVTSNVLSNTSNRLADYNNLYNRPDIFTKTETSNIYVTSNVLSNTSNRLADYNNLYNRPDIFTKTETSNIFVTSNVLSNTSNRLADYNNLYNRPDIFIKTETSNIFVTSNVLSNTSNRLADYNNLYNRPDIFTKTETSNIFVTSNVLSNTSNRLADYNNLYNRPDIFIKTETSNIFVTSNVLSNTSNRLADYNNLYNRPDIFTKTETSNIFVTSNVLSNTSNTLADYNNLYNRPDIFTKTETSNIFVTSNVLSNTSNRLADYNNLYNRPILFNITNASNASSNVYNYLIIGSSNEIYSNSSNYTFNTSNKLIEQINLLNTDTLPIGTTNKFITNNTYNNNLSITGILNVSNITTSNLKVIGSSTRIETDIYVTEKLEIVNDSSETSLTVKQIGINQNVAEFYNNTNPTFIISSNNNIGIGIRNPNIIYKLDINGSLNTTDLFVNNNNINSIYLTQANASSTYLTPTNASNIFVTSNVLSNTSNRLADYNNLYNRPDIFTKTETSNIFVTSNVLSNTSNRLADYNNLYNRPDIFTKTETSNIFVTSNVLSNTSNRLADYNNLYNRPDIFTKTETSNIFVTSNVLSNTSNRLADYNNLYNRPDIFTKTETSNIFVTSNVLSNTSNRLADYNNLYNRPDIFTKIETSNIFVTSNVLSNTSNRLADYNNLYNRPDIFTKTETSNIFVTSNVLSNTSNRLADYNNLYNRPDIFTKTETSNIFVTSNVLSNTSNRLADYNNLYNRPDIFTKTETSNIFVTSNVLSNTSNRLADYNNLYNRPDIFTKTETSNIFVTSNVLSNTSNRLADYNNLYNRPDIFTKTETSNIFVTSNVLSNTSNRLADYNNLYNRPDIFTKIETSNIFVTSNVLSNTSNRLADYNNLYNRPDIFTKTETSNIFVTSNVLSNTSNRLADYNNLYNRPDIFTKTETSNIFVTSNVLSNTSNRLADYNNLYNRPDIFTKTETSNIFVTSNVLSNTSNRLADYNNLYNRPDIFTKTETSNIFVTSNVLSNTSNRLADYNNLYNRPDIFTKTETSNIFVTSNVLSNTSNRLADYNNLYNRPILFNITNASNASSNVYNYLIIGSSNEIYSNSSNYTFNTSNKLIEKISLLNTDTLPVGTNNKFITNNTYNNNLSITGILNVSNITTSNLKVIGSSTRIETDIYVTEKLEIVNDSSETSLAVKQMGINQNVAEFYNNTNPTFIISSNSSVGIGINIPTEKLHINNGNLLLSGNWTAGTSYKIIGYNTAKQLEFHYDNGTSIKDNNRISFWTGWNGTNHTERLRINTDGSLFLGNTEIINTINQQIDNGYKLIFDNSYTATGTNKCNKILLHNITTSPGYLAGFGVEYTGIAYSVWTNGQHRFYTDTTNSSGGNLQLSIKPTSVHIGENVSNGTNRTLIINSINNGADSGETDILNTPFLIYNTIKTSQTVLNDPQPLMKLIRHGTGEQSYAAKAVFKLCRYEHTASFDSRTRMDINLSHGTYDDINIMSIRSDGNVGIGITNPTAKLHIPTPDNTSVTTQLLNFRNVSDYGIYATATSIGNRGNTLDFLAKDYNSGSGIQTRNLLTLRPEGNIGIGLTNPQQIFHIRGGTNSSFIRIETNTDNINQTSGIEFGIPAFNSSTRAKIQSTTLAGDASDLQLFTSSSTNNSSLKMIITSTGNIGIGTNTPLQKLHIEDGSVFIGDTSVGNGAVIDNGYKLIFDSSYTSIGNNKCNKIVLHKNATTAIAGFGVENGAVAYSVWSGGEHRFYTSTSETSGGNLTSSFKYNNHRLYGDNNAETDLFVKNISTGSGAYSAIAVINGNNQGCYLFLNSPNRSADGGINTATLRNDVGSLKLSAGGTGPYMFMNSSTGNAGIDIANPSYKLDVNGTFRTSDNIYINNNKYIYSTDTGGNRFRILFGNDSFTSFGSPTGFKFRNSADTTDTLLIDNINNSITINGIINTSSNLNISASSSTNAGIIWANYGTSAIACAGNANQFSLNANQGDLIIRSDINKNLILQNGSNLAGLVINNNNIGIGTNIPNHLVEIINTNYTGPLLTLDTGIINASTQMPRAIGQPLIKIGKNSYSTTAGDYYGIGFGYSPLLNDKQCCEIGTIITNKTGYETGDLIFSTRPNTTNIASTERMRIMSDGNIGIGVTNPQSKLEIAGSMNAYGFSLKNTISNWQTTLNLTSDDGNNSYNINLGNSGNNLIGNKAFGIFNNNTGFQNFVTVWKNGNFGLGLGNLNPQYPLDVLGDINCTGNFRINGIAFTGSSQWITSETNIYNSNSGNIGIGTTNPKYLLDVNGTINCSNVIMNNFNLSNVVLNANNYIVNSDLYELSGLSTVVSLTTNYSEQLVYTYNKLYNDSTVIINANLSYNIGGTGTDGFKSQLKLISGSVTTYSIENTQYFRGTTSGTGTRSGILSGMYAKITSSSSTVRISFLLAINGTSDDSITLYGVQYFIVEQKNTLATLPLNYTLNSLDFTITDSSNIKLKNNYFTNSIINTNNIIYNSGNVGIGTTNPLEKLDIIGNINCEGGITLAGSTAFLNTTNVDSANTTNTYINFKPAGSISDWCYLRQIGGSQEIKLALDFHDDVDARFCIRSVQSTAVPDAIKEVFLVDNSYTYANGLRLSGEDVGNTIWQQTGNLGISANTGNNILFHIGNGLERMRIKSDGNVGIGNNNPQHKLHVSGALYLDTNPSNPGNTLSASFWNQSGIGPTISGSSFSVQTNGTTEALRITNSGNVGIGTINPTSKLTIKATYNDINSGLNINADDDTTVDKYSLKIYPLVQGGGSVGYNFRINSHTTTNVNSLFLGFNGNVGIGVTNPQTKFEILGAGRIASLYTTGSGASSYMGFTNSGDTRNCYIGIDGSGLCDFERGALLMGTWSDKSIIFTTGNPNTEKMRLLSSGNLGIGLTNPQYKLDVNGDLNFSGTLRQNGNQFSGFITQGMTVQTKQITYTKMTSKTVTGWAAVDDNLTEGFVISITPTSTSSKVLLNIYAHIGNDKTSDSRWWGFKLYRKIGTGAWTEITNANGTKTGTASTTNGTPVWISQTAGSGDNYYDYTIHNVSGSYLDNPNTTSIVYYTVYWNNRMGDGASAVANAIWINRAGAGQNDAYRPAPVSSWTASEIWDSGTPYSPPAQTNTITLASGNVGINTTTPQNKLHISSGLATAGMSFPLKISASTYINTGNNTGTFFGLGTEDGSWSKCGIGHVRTNGFDVGDIAFLLNNSADSTTCSMTDERMRIKSDGNIGIGITNPTAKLHIINSSTSTDALTAGTHLYCYNPTNSSGQNSIITTRIGGGSAGSAAISFDVSGVHGWKIYLPANNNSLRINNSWSVGSGTDILTVNSSGINVTGDIYDNGVILQNHLFNNTGRAHNAYFDFNSPTNFGYNFIQGSANGPGTLTQHYSWNIGLGSEYPWTGEASYGCQFALPRNVANPYLSIRYKEANSLGAWYKISAGYADSAGTLSGNPTIGGNTTISGNLTVDGHFYWKANLNNYLTATANNQNWSFDLTNQNTYTGCYWTVWSDKTGVNEILVVRGDTANVGISTTAPAFKLHVVGDIAATGDLIGYYSDERLKTITSNINNPLEIINNLNGFYYKSNDLAKSFGYENSNQEIGLSAQEVQKVLPELVRLAPFDTIKDDNGELKSKSGENYLTVDYKRLVPVLIEAMKEMNNKFTNEINDLKAKIDYLMKK